MNPPAPVITIKSSFFVCCIINLSLAKLVFLQVGAAANHRPAPEKIVVSK